jgi:MoaA/NifB/PqqE/SkfB family radical SAM enzyme
MEGSRVEDYDAPLFLAWQLTSECDLRCLHCCEESGHSMPDEMGHEELLNFCEQIVKLKIPYVAISGGEPLLHPEFFKICEFIRAGGSSLKVETNGLSIDRKVARKIAGLNFRSVQVSLDGATPATHERLRLNGNWKKTVDACKYLIEEGVNTEIVFVPTRFNIHEIGDAIDLAASLGIYGFYTGKIMRIGRAAENWSILCPSNEDYEKFFIALKKKTEEYNGRMKVYYYPYDVIEELRYRLKCPSASLLVIPNGKVKLIGPLPFICGDVRRDSLKEIWAKYKKAWRDPQVIEFANKVITNPALLAEANRWVELYQ